MIEAKPIFTVKVPLYVTNDVISNVNELLSRRMPDYHILCFRTAGVVEIQFAAFYAKDIVETDFEQFKKEVLAVTANVNTDSL